LVCFILDAFELVDIPCLPFHESWPSYRYPFLPALCPTVDKGRHRLDLRLY
jgi:hypothetical protein